MIVRQRTLPRDGLIRGARGHKQIVVPKGTTVWVIEHNYLLFHTVYLNKEQADTCLKGLTTGKRLDLHTLIQWNFTSAFPTRVAREK